MNSLQGGDNERNKGQSNVICVKKEEKEKKKEEKVCVYVCCVWVFASIPIKHVWRSAKETTFGCLLGKELGDRYEME